jgi:tRNA(fMet)-specific endonuclease VapC
MISLDTDVLIEILDKRSEKGSEALIRILESGEKAFTTAINVHEILYGLHKYGKPVKEILLLPISDFGRKDAELSCKMELAAEKVGSPIRRTDAMIAAIAINNGAMLYTFDLKHFSPIKANGLKLFS